MLIMLSGDTPQREVCVVGHRFDAVFTLDTEKLGAAVAACLIPSRKEPCALTS
jgi:hypothetical protein